MTSVLIVLFTVGVLVLIMRWVFAPPRRSHVPPPVDAAAGADLGLLVVLATALDPMEARWLQGELEAAGIRASTSRRKDRRLDLLVFAEDLAAARAILSA